MLRLSGRVRRILVAVLAGLVVIVAVALAILPEVVRPVAVDQVPKLTGGVNERALEFAVPRDLESLRAQEVTLRIQGLQLARGLPDFAAAVTN
jgi:hypothetical protein